MTYFLALPEFYVCSGLIGCGGNDMFHYIYTVFLTTYLKGGKGQNWKMGQISSQVQGVSC